MTKEKKCSDKNQSLHRILLLQNVYLCTLFVKFRNLPVYLSLLKENGMTCFPEGHKKFAKQIQVLTGPYWLDLKCKDNFFLLNSKTFTS